MRSCPACRMPESQDEESKELCCSEYLRAVTVASHNLKTFLDGVQEYEQLTHSRIVVAKDDDGAYRFSPVLLGGGGMSTLQTLLAGLERASNACPSTLRSMVKAGQEAFRNECLHCGTDLSGGAQCTYCLNDAPKRQPERQPERDDEREERLKRLRP